MDKKSKLAEPSDIDVAITRSEPMLDSMETIETSPEEIRETQSEPIIETIREQTTSDQVEASDTKTDPTKIDKQVMLLKIPSLDDERRYQHLIERFDKIVVSVETARNKLHDFDDIKDELKITSARLIELEARDLEKSLKLEEFARVESNLKEVNLKLESLTEEVAMLRQTLSDAESTRRKLNNTIQDLKGNIRVFCRVRPPISEAEAEKPRCTINYVDENIIEIGRIKVSSGISGKHSEVKAEFKFDRIFSPDCSQTYFFEELSLLVQSAMDGYNVCVFAYGQTGSGKTYTMQGGMTQENLGMIPRSVNLIFKMIKTLAQIGWEYTVQVSFMEIYNDKVRDLLDPHSNRNLEICHNEGRGTTVSNLIIQQINSPQEFQNLMMTALKHRVVAATNFNETSSRSHAVTKIYLNGANKNAEVTYKGSISLVDLAGSECAKFIRPERMAETKCINKSLTALGTVISALCNKQRHIPYRNSKLTFLLQSSLSGSSKTLMIVNITPFEENFSENLTSLRFASKVKEVKTSAKRNRSC